MDEGADTGGWSAQAVRLVLALLLGATFVAAPTRVSAKECGDDVAGERVACACGDSVVTSTRLRADDPIFKGRCRRDGLIVRGAATAETIVLDLNGLSLIGTGGGVGVDVQRGGSDGAAIIGGPAGDRGEIVGFGVGLQALTPSAIRRVERLEIEGNRREGILIRTAGTMVVDVRLLRNGGDGARVSGQGGRWLDVDATENSGAGIRMATRDVMLRARATANGRNGIISGGIRNDLRGSSAQDNTGYGVLLGGNRHVIDDLVATGNSLGDVAQRGVGTQR
jgi:hypothetical protein